MARQHVHFLPCSGAPDADALVGTTFAAISIVSCLADAIMSAESACNSWLLGSNHISMQALGLAMHAC